MPEYFQFWWIFLVLTSTAGRTVNALLEARELGKTENEGEKPIVFPEFIRVRMRVGAAAAISIEVTGCGSHFSSSPPFPPDHPTCIALPPLHRVDFLIGIIRIN